MCQNNGILVLIAKGLLFMDAQPPIPIFFPLVYTVPKAIDPSESNCSPKGEAPNWGANSGGGIAPAVRNPLGLEYCISTNSIPPEPLAQIASRNLDIKKEVV